MLEKEFFLIKKTVTIKAKHLELLNLRNSMSNQSGAILTNFTPFRIYIMDFVITTYVKNSSL